MITPPQPSSHAERQPMTEPQDGNEDSQQQRLKDLPYDERRLIVVAKPETVPKDREDSWTEPAVESVIAAAIAAALRPGLGGIIGLVGPPVLRAAANFRKRAEAQQFVGEFRVISPVEARQLTFPADHYPRRKVVYVGHPLDPVVYLPFASFHSFLFEHKVAEAMRLLRALGATTISIVRTSGWDQTAGVRVDVPVEGVDVGASAGMRNSAEAYVETTMTLNPTKAPHLPEDLVWFPHEPLWKEMAEARLESGLIAFDLEVNSGADFGVDVGLKAMIEKSGLNIGGEYVKHEKTMWKMKGTFRPESRPG